MRPADRLPELAAAVRPALVEMAEAGIGVRLKDAAATLQMPTRMSASKFLEEFVRTRSERPLPADSVEKHLFASAESWRS